MAGAGVCRTVRVASGPVQGARVVPSSAAKGPEGEAIAALSSDPRVIPLYEQYLEHLHEITGGEVFVHYASPGLWWAHGAFGTKRYQGQDLRETPKHAALEAFDRRHRAPQ